jgi:hypothetical protein
MSMNWEGSGRKNKLLVAKENAANRRKKING